MLPVARRSIPVKTGLGAVCPKSVIKGVNEVITAFGCWKLKNLQLYYSKNRYYQALTSITSPNFLNFQFLMTDLGLLFLVFAFEGKLSMKWPKVENSR